MCRAQDAGGAPSADGELAGVMRGYGCGLGYDPDMVRMPVTDVSPGTVRSLLRAHLPRVPFLLVGCRLARARAPERLLRRARALTASHARSQVTAAVEYMQELPLVDGEYTLTVPLALPGGVHAAPLAEVLTVAATINAGMPGLRWACKSHPLAVVRAPAAAPGAPAAAPGAPAPAAPGAARQGGRPAATLEDAHVALSLDATRPVNNDDLVLSYRTASRVPVATLL